jgi:lactoylglutathione lyase
MLKQFDMLMVYVQDMQRSVAFYRDILGLPLQMESPGWSQFDLGNGVTLGLHPARGLQPEPVSGWTPGFKVDDVRAARERVVSAGAEISSDFHDIPGGVVLEFADPDGNRIDVTQMGINCAELGVVSV